MLFQSDCNQGDTLGRPKFACILSNGKVSQTNQSGLRGPFLYVMPKFIAEATSNILKLYNARQPL